MTQRDLRSCLDRAAALAALVPRRRPAPPAPGAAVCSRRDCDLRGGMAERAARSFGGHRHASTASPTAEDRRHGARCRSGSSRPRPTPPVGVALLRGARSIPDGDRRNAAAAGARSSDPRGPRRFDRTLLLRPRLPARVKVGRDPGGAQDDRRADACRSRPGRATRSPRCGTCACLPLAPGFQRGAAASTRRSASRDLKFTVHAPETMTVTRARTFSAFELEPRFTRAGADAPAFRRRSGSRDDARRLPLLVGDRARASAAFA